MRKYDVSEMVAHVFLWKNPPALEDAWRAAARGKRYFFFLDSVHAAGGGRWSYFSLSEPGKVFSSRGKTVTIESAGWRRKIIKDSSPLLELKKLFPKLESCMAAVPFCGGGVGYFSYDFGRNFEVLPSKAREDVRVPESMLMFCNDFCAYDLSNNNAYVVIMGGKHDRALCGAKAAEYIKQLIASPMPPADGNMRSGRISSRTDRIDFEKAVRRAKKYISNGDIYQANLAQRFACDYPGDTTALYRRLRKLNPSPYSAYIRVPELTIISCSPELLLRKRGLLVETRPIAGTRRRGKDAPDDHRLSSDLLLDPKERAEHIMLVDLERNDLGRVCVPKSVKVNEKMVIEKYSHVIHIVSNVRGVLQKEKDFFDAFRAVFPGGTITGCPKIRSMEIIDELEPVRRGPYCGSAGWIGYNGDADLNILIRSIVALPRRGKNWRLYFSAGAGIVADSNPSREYRETLHKANALFAAIKNVK